MTTTPALVLFSVTGRPRKRWSDDNEEPEVTVSIGGIVAREHGTETVNDFKKMAMADDAFRCCERACVQEGVFGIMREVLRHDKKRRSPRRFEVEQSAIAGWLDLGALWLFTTDQLLFSNTAALLGV